MIDDYVEKLISESIPERKYNNEWDHEFLKINLKYLILNFQSNLGLKKKVDEEEIRKDYMIV